jgi:hypothetical protein
LDFLQSSCGLQKASHHKVKNQTGLPDVMSTTQRSSRHEFGPGSGDKFEAKVCKPRTGIGCQDQKRGSIGAKNRPHELEHSENWLHWSQKQAARSGAFRKLAPLEPKTGRTIWRIPKIGSIGAKNRSRDLAHSENWLHWSQKQWWPCVRTNI